MSSLLVRNCAGDELLAEIERDRADVWLHDVKVAVMEEWRVPPLCQSFVCGDRLMDGSEALHQVLDGVEVPLLTVVVSLDETIRGLVSGKRAVRTHAMQAVRQLHRGGRQDVFDRLIVHLTHESKSVRKRAVESLSELAESGNQLVLGALTTSIHDRDSEVREAAVLGVSKVAMHGDPLAVAPLVALRGDTSYKMRVLVLQVLPDIVDKGDADVISAMADFLEHDDSDVRFEVAMGLIVVAEVGDDNAVACVVDRLSDARLGVRQAALNSLRAVTSENDLRRVDALSRCLDDPDSAFVGAVKRALGRHFQECELSPSAACTQESGPTSQFLVQDSST